MKCILKRYRKGRFTMRDDLPLNTAYDAKVITNHVSVCIAHGGNCVIEFPPDDADMIHCWASQWRGRRSAAALTQRLLLYIERPNGRRDYKPDPITGKIKLYPRDPDFKLRSKENG